MNIDASDLAAICDRFLEMYKPGGGGPQAVGAMAYALEYLPDMVVVDEVLNKSNDHFADAVAERVVSDLVQLNSLTDEDLRLIREHVRPKDAGDAVEAAVLAERIRCARAAQYFGANGSIMDAILTGMEPAK